MKELKDLEKIIADITTPPESMPKGMLFKSKVVKMPVPFILDKMGLGKDLNNYRTHTIKGTEELADSIEEVGLIEPLQFNYDTKTGRWDFSDGRGRFWSAFERNADYIDVEVFYDVPKELWTDISIGANATKMKIPSEDIAVFANRFYLLLERYFDVDSSRIDKLAKENTQIEMMAHEGAFNIKKFSKIIGRSESTVRDYLLFAKSHEYIIRYVLNHQSENLYSRAVSISRNIENKNEQKKFFTYILDKQSKDYREAKKQFKKAKKFKGQRLVKKMSDQTFAKELKERVKILSGKTKFELESEPSIHKNGNGVAKELVNRTVYAKKSIESFAKIVRHSQEFKETTKKVKLPEYGTIGEYICSLAMQLEDVISTATDKLREHVYNIIHKPVVLTFQEKIFRDAMKRRSKGETLEQLTEKYVKAFGGDIHYPTIDTVHLPKNQLRRHYDVEGIKAMAETMKKYDQRKAGIVRTVGDHYETIVGSSRLQAARLAGKPMYKTFIVDGLTPTEIAILQCMEDMHERDTVAERAEALAKQYYIRKRELEHSGVKDYTPEKFAREHRHLASEKTILNSVAFHSLNDVVKGFVSSGVLGYMDAIMLSPLPHDAQLETAYSIMINNPTKDELEKLVNKAHVSIVNESMFDMKTNVSYSSVYKSFTENSLAPIKYYNHLRKTNHKVLASNSPLFIAYAKMMRSINDLKDALN